MAFLPSVHWTCTFGTITMHFVKAKTSRKNCQVIIWGGSQTSEAVPYRFSISLDIFLLFLFLLESIFHLDMRMGAVPATEESSRHHHEPQNPCDPCVLFSEAHSFFVSIFKHSFHLLLYHASCPLLDTLSFLHYEVWSSCQPVGNAFHIEAAIT